MVTSSSRAPGARRRRAVPLELCVGSYEGPAHPITGVTTLGSAPDNTIVVPGQNLAAHQLRLAPVEGGLEVTNLDASVPMRQLSRDRTPAVLRARVCAPGELTVGGLPLIFDGSLLPPKVHPGAHGIIGSAPAIEALRRSIEACAAHERPVLLEGRCWDLACQAGRAIHAASARSQGPLVRDMAIQFHGPSGLGELTGYTPAAFLGAADHQGYLARSHRGTLLVTGLEDLPPERLPHLVRMLRERQVTRLGATAPEPADVRLIVTLRGQEPVHPDIAAFVRGFERVRIPGVTEYAEDIPALVAHYTERERFGAGVEWSDEALDMVGGMVLPTLAWLEVVVSHCLQQLMDDWRAVVEARDVIKAVERDLRHWVGGALTDGGTVH